MSLRCRSIHTIGMTFHCCLVNFICGVDFTIETGSFYHFRHLPTNALSHPSAYLNTKLACLSFEWFHFGAYAQFVRLIYWLQRRLRFGYSRSVVLVLFRQSYWFFVSLMIATRKLYLWCWYRTETGSSVILSVLNDFRIACSCYNRMPSLV